MATLACLIKIAWRNIFRNKRRTILTSFILILGTSGLILVGGFFESLLDRLREATIASQTGHLQISSLGYQEKGVVEPYGYMIKDLPLLEKLVRKETRILHVLPRLHLEEMLSTDRNSLSVWVVGVDPVGEEAIQKKFYREEPATGSTLIAGKDLDAKDPNGIVVGPGLLKALDLQIGSTVSFITTRPQGSMEGANFHIRGVLDSAIKEAGDRILRIPMKTAQDLLGLPHQAHSLLLILDYTSNTSLVQNSLQTLLAEFPQSLEISPWESRAKIYWQSEKFLKRIYLIVQVIIAVIFFFSIANTINMALFERMREYGTMMALGNNRRIIFTVIALEAAFLGLMGSLLGIGAGVGLGKIISSLKIYIPSPPPGDINFKLWVMILAQPPLLLQAFLIGLLATLLASIIPAYRVSHKPIIKALEYV